MSYQLTRDEQVFQRFWNDEKQNTPRWFNDFSEAWTCDWDAFKAFCDNSERIYFLDAVALLYVERRDKSANVHFSLLRGHKINPNDLLSIKDELLKDFDMIFGWVSPKNRGLVKLVESCGMRWDGTRMYFGESHGQLLEWRQYFVAKPVVSC